MELNTSKVESNENDKSIVHVDMLALFYIVGIIGSFLALLHLYSIKYFKNTKQAFMLK